MTRLLPRGRRGASTGNMVVVIAGLTVAAALFYPSWSVRDFRSRVAAATADVDAVSASALGILENTRRWPTATPPGEAPPEMSSLAGEGGAFDRERYVLEWTSLEVVDSVRAPPPQDLPSADDAPRESDPVMLPVVRGVGAVRVYSADPTLLAELLVHYPTDASFVLDTVWTLVLPERAEPILGR